jgi:formimidoylglutamate deiminase
MQPWETARLAATGAVAGLCPITEANLGDGIFDGVRWRAAGGRLGVGSDSNVLISLTEELRLLDYGQRLRDGSRAALAAPGGSTGRALWEAAAAGGAQAAGREAGKIAVGAWADLVAVSTDTPALAGRRGDAALDSLVFASPGNGPVSEVWSAGRHMVTGGRHVRREEILRPAMAALAALGAAV